MVMSVFVVLLVKLVPLEKKERVVCPDPKGLLDLLVQMDPLEHQVILVKMEIKDPWVNLEMLVDLANKEQEEILVKMVFQEVPVLQENKDKLVYRDLVVLKVHQENKDHEVFQDDLVHLVNQDLKVILVEMVFLD